MRLNLNLGLTARYAAFAAVATAINLGAQMGVLRVYSGGNALYLALGIGTGSGLVIKYVLDKRWIFRNGRMGIRAHGRMFTLYALMGLITTAIFWGAEVLCHAIAPDGDFLYVGGLVGLTVGYGSKYWLDRRYVFGGRA